MTPQEFARQTHVLGAPKNWDASKLGRCAGLPVVIEDNGCLSSYWKPSWREVLRLMCGGSVRLTVASISHPAVSLTAERAP